MNTEVKQNTQTYMRVRRRRSKRRIRRVYRGIYLFLLILSLGSAFSFLGYRGYTEYSRDTLLAHMSVQHLQKAQVLMMSILKGAFNPQMVQLTKQEFSDAAASLGELRSDLSSLPSFSTALPIYGEQVNTAVHLVPLALKLSEIGMAGCNILDILFLRLQAPFMSKGQGLTMNDIDIIRNNLSQIKTAFTVVENETRQVQGTNTSLDSRINKLINTLSQDIPMIHEWLDNADRFLSVAPTVLGINTPSNYLLEILDSTELRPEGGFIGNYGIVTLSGARLVAAHVTDVDLLDRPFEDRGNSIPYPQAYSWFKLAPSWSLRDSGLDADFPTVAKYSELNYIREGGNIPVQGVIAITPALIERALLITGPIAVPEYQETVTSQNLVARIHFHQLGGAASYEGSDRIASSDGYSSLRKRFTSLLAEHLLTRIRQLTSSDTSKFIQLFASAMRSKDIQVYLNSNDAENILHHYHMDAAIQTPSDNNIFVVDTNIAGNKANSFITTAIDDQISIDEQGTAAHHTTLTYTWTTPGAIYGNPVYKDYVRVYVPNGSTLLEQGGWQGQGTSNGFNHEVWAGLFTLTYGHTHTITLIWTAHYAAQNDINGWSYHYLIQRQAGTAWTLHLHIRLPSCSSIRSTAGGLTSSDKQSAVLNHALDENINVEVEYVCQ